MTGTLALVVTGFLFSSANPNADPVKQELDKLQGTWVIVAETMEGKETPESRYNKRYTFQGDHFSIPFKGAEKPLIELRIEVNPTTQPKTIDMIGLKSHMVLLPGIYELDGDTLKLCIPVGTSDRPQAFKSEAGSKSGIVVYKRVKE